MQSCQASLDELALDKLEIPSGGARPIDWSGAHPVLTLRVQQAFGWTDTPRLVDGRIPLVLHLTDPAGRPTAVTSDLTSFWKGPYRQVRAQLRGRYPKHPWPEDPLHAQPTNRAKRRGVARPLPRAWRTVTKFADDPPPVGQVFGRHLVGVEVCHGGTLEAQFAQLRVGRHAHGTQLGNELAFLSERDDFAGRGARECGPHIIFEITNI